MKAIQRYTITTRRSQVVSLPVDAQPVDVKPAAAGLMHLRALVNQEGTIVALREIVITQDGEPVPEEAVYCGTGYTALGQRVHHVWLLGFVETS